MRLFLRFFFLLFAVCLAGISLPLAARTVPHLMPGRLAIANPGGSSLAKSSAASGDEKWADLFGSGSLDGDVYAMASDPQGRVYVGGSFRKSGNQVLNGIARWNGTSWDLFGTTAQNGVDGMVFAIAVEGNDVYVGGRFTTAGGVPAVNIAHWNWSTNSWNAVAGGIGAGDPTAYVGALAVTEGDVYAGGWFSTAGTVAANNVANWNGTIWKAMGSAATNGTDGDVLAIASQGNDLFVGGSFRTAGGSIANNIARWSLSDQKWGSIVDSSGLIGLDGYVNALVFGRTELYVGGSFLKVCPNPWPHPNPKVDSAFNVVRWAGTRWLATGNAFDLGPRGDGRMIYDNIGPDNVVRTLAAQGDSIYVGGTFRSSRPGSKTSGQMPTYYVALFEGGSGVWLNLAWATLGAGTTGYVNALAPSGANIFVGGDFRSAGNQPLSRLARWNVPTNAWSGLRSGPSGNIMAVALHGSSDVWAAGLMATPSGASGYRLARWSGTQWLTLATTVNGPIYAMTISGDDIYVGGLFSQAGNVAAANIARYNITTGQWSSLGGSGVGGIGTTYVAAIAVRGKDVYVGGDFTIADEVAAHSIARWDGTNWFAVGGGVDGWVNALAVGSSGELYAGGVFGNAGGVAANNIANWDGTKWSALGTGVNDAVRTLTAGSGGNLYAGGEFTGAGSVGSGGIIQWDGSKWVTMAGGLSGGLLPTAASIVVVGNVVYAGGLFVYAGGVRANNIARWDGTAWRGLGSGVDDQVRGMAVGGSILYVGGDFNMAGEKASFKFGEWTDVPNSIKPKDEGDGSAVALVSVNPNPVATKAAVHLDLQDHPLQGNVRVAVYDGLGREMALLYDGDASAATGQLEWDASGTSAGVYYISLRGESYFRSWPVLVRH